MATELDPTLPVLESMTRGDDRTIKITATYPEAIPESGIAAGDPYPLGDKQIWFTAKYRTRGVPDSDAVFQKTSDLAPGGITVRANPNDHIADVDIDPEDTADMPKAATLICDVQAKGAATWTVWKGYLPIVEDVTRAT